MLILVAIRVLATPMEKSFFEKLTGSLKAEEEKSKVVKPKKKRVDLQEEDTDMPTHPEELKEEPDMKSASEEEGQLTIDVYQTDKDIVIKSTVAGVKPENIDISITNEMVTVKGQRPKDEEIPQEDYFYQECYWGPFSRSIILPQDIIADKAEASMKNGILTIRLPKAHAVTTKKLQVKTEI